MNKLTTMLLAFGFALASGQAFACTTPANVNALAQEIATGVNAQRRANGQSAVRYNQKLGQAAMAHACDMAVNNFFGHNGSNGSTVQRRVQSTGYRNCLVAENIAWGYPQSGQIISLWMDSAGHRANMLHPRVTEIGVAIANGPKGPNWVLVLANGC